MHVLHLFQTRRSVCLLEPSQFKVTTSAGADAVYRWNTKMVANHFCADYGCSTFVDIPAFELDGSWMARHGVSE